METIEQYGQLMLAQELWVQVLAQPVVAMEIAQVEARRQQLFPKRVMEPRVSDEALKPERWRPVFTVFGLNVIGIGVLRLLIAGRMEHGTIRP